MEAFRPCKVDIRKSKRYTNWSGGNKLSLLVDSKIIYLENPRESAKKLLQISISKMARENINI